MTFLTSPRECLYSLLIRRIWRSKRESLLVLLQLLRYAVPLNDGNCRLTIPVGKGRCVHDALPNVFNIDVFKYNKSNSTKTRHIYFDSANLIKLWGCFLYQWLVETSIIGAVTDTGSLLIRVRLRYTRDYLTLGRCSLIKAAAMENWYYSPPKSTQPCCNATILPTKYVQ